MITFEDVNGNPVEEDLHLFTDKNELIEKKAKILVPLSFLLLTDHLTKYVKQNEYAILYNVERIPNTLTWAINTDDVLIPQQKVSSATVEFLNIEEVRRYNGVVHRHPSGCRKFSSTDETKLNSLFTASWIYIPFLEMPDACVNINVDDVAKVQVEAVCEVFDDCSNELTPIFDINKKGFNISDDSILVMLNNRFPQAMEQLKVWKDWIQEISYALPGMGLGLQGNRNYGGVNNRSGYHAPAKKTKGNVNANVGGNHFKQPNVVGTPELPELDATAMDMFGYPFNQLNLMERDLLGSLLVDSDASSIDVDDLIGKK